MKKAWRIYQSEMENRTEVQGGKDALPGWVERLRRYGLRERQSHQSRGFYEPH